MLSHFAPLLLGRDTVAGDNMTGQDGSEPGGLLPRDQTIFAVVAFTSVALYNVVELTCIIFTTFKKRRGLYFVSFCVATWGIPPYSIAFLLLGIDPPGPQSLAIYGYVTGIVVGWICTVSGQSVVLYSRLHLIDRNQRHLRFVLAMIITNGVILHSATTVMVFGANSTQHSNLFEKPYSIMEKVQVTVFFVQVSIYNPRGNPRLIISRLSNTLTRNSSYLYFTFLPQSSSSGTQRSTQHPLAPGCCGVSSLSTSWLSCWISQFWGWSLQTCTSYRPRTRPCPTP